MNKKISRLVLLALIIAAPAQGMQRAWNWVALAGAGLAATAGAYYYGMFDRKKITPYQLETTLQGHTGWVSTLAELSDGRIVSGSGDSAIRIWNPTTGEVGQILRDPVNPSPINKIIVLQNGNIAALSGGVINIWDPTTGTLEQTLRTNRAISNVVELCDGRIASVNGNDITIWNATSGAIEQILHENWHIDHLATLADGRIVTSTFIPAHADSETKISIWNPADGSIEKTFYVGTLFSFLMELDAFEEKIFFKLRNSVSIWNSETDSWETGIPSAVTDVITPLRNTKIALVNSRTLNYSNEFIEIWNLGSQTREQALNNHARVYSMIELEDGRILAGLADGTINIWSLS